MDRWTTLNLMPDSHKRMPPFLLYAFLGHLSHAVALCWDGQTRTPKQVACAVLRGLAVGDALVIVDLELPRLGLIRVNAFDEVLQQVRIP